MLKWDSTRNTRGFVARTLQIASLAGKESTEAPCNYTPMKFNMDPQVLVWEDTFLLGTVLTSSYNWNSIAWFRNAKIRSDSTYPESIILCWHETQIFGKGIVGSCSTKSTYSRVSNVFHPLNRSQLASWSIVFNPYFANACWFYSFTLFDRTGLWGNWT